MEISHRNKTLAYIIIGIFVFFFILILLIVILSDNSSKEKDVFDLPDHLDASSCPKDLSPLPVILISLDGFSPKYLERGVTPTLKKMIEKGSSTPFMTSVFPSSTFPNHYTIVTGLYPESHGIISNSFYDPFYKAKFSYKTSESHKGRWWGGEPIWITLMKNNLSSATFFWPGSEAPIQGHHPTHWLKFDKNIPLDKRVNKVLEWLNLPPPKRPSWISLYSQQPDVAGHKFGPDSDEVTDKLRKVDEMVRHLLEGLHDRKLLSCVNILVVADHGMASSSYDKVIHLEEFIPEELSDNIYFSPGAFGRITLKKRYKNMTEKLEESLSCKKKELKMFRSEELPKHFHYGNNQRIGDYVLVLEAGFSVSLNSNFSLKGLHGYDSHKPSMHALFVAYGPAFKENFKVKPFQNKELYNLMCRLLDITPSPNNGTKELLDIMLRDPPSYSDVEQRERPPTLGIEDEPKWTLNYEESDCSKNNKTIELSVKLLNMSDEQMSKVEKEASPWGIPQHKFKDSIKLLFHPDHITGYSAALKLPLWTSFTVRRMLPENSDIHWVSDVRLGKNLSPSCSGHENISQSDLTLLPLFQPEFSKTETTKTLSSLISNAALFSKQLDTHWSKLMLTLIPKWLKDSKSSLNVIVGPIFDHNSDGRIDDKVSIDDETSIPTDYFAIVTKCLSDSEEENFKDCPEDHLDSLAFIYPQKLTVGNDCFKNVDEYALLFSANIQDVERLTGLKFFSQLPRRRRLELVTEAYYKLW